MPAKLQHIYVYSGADYGTTEVKPTGETNDLINFIPTSVIREGDLGEPEKLSFEVFGGSGWHVERKLSFRTRLVLVYDDATKREYRIRKVHYDTHGEMNVRVEAQAIWQDLFDMRFRYILGSQDLELVPGDVTYNFPLYRLTAGEMLDIIFDSAYGIDGYFALGTVDAAVAATEISVNVERASIGELLRLLCEGAKCEFEVRSGLNEWFFDFFEEAGWATSERTAGAPDPSLRPIEAPTGGLVTTRANSLALRIEDAQDDFFSMVVPIANDGYTGVGAIDWDIVGYVYDPAYTNPDFPAVLGATYVTLADSPIYLTGIIANGDFYAMLVSGGDLYTFRIFETTAPNVIVIEDEGTIFAGTNPTVVRFVSTRGAGKVGAGITEVTYVYDPDAEAEKGRVEIEKVFEEAIPFDNIFEESGGSGDMSEWSGGLPAGIVASGAVVTEVSEALYVRFGTKAAKITGDTGAYVETSPVTLAPSKQQPWHSTWISARAVTGAVRLQFIDVNGNALPKGKEQADLISDETLEIAIGGEEVPAGATKVRLLILEDGTEFYLDALTITNSQSAWPFSQYMGKKALYRRGYEYLLEHGGVQDPSYESEFIDLSQLGGADTEVELGSWVRIRDMVSGDGVDTRITTQGDTRVTTQGDVRVVIGAGFWQVAVDARVKHIRIAEDISHGRWKKAIKVERRRPSIESRFQSSPGIISKIAPATDYDSDPVPVDRHRPTGDGTTDDSGSLQAAIDEAAASGREVKLGGKIYGSGTTLNMTPGCMGILGPGTIKALAGVTGDPMLLLSGNEDISISGVGFDANAFAAQAIFADDLHNSEIAFCKAWGFGDVTKGIQLQGDCTGNFIRKNRLEMASTPGLIESIGISLLSPIGSAQRTVAGNLSGGYYDAFTGTVAGGSLDRVTITAALFTAGDVGKLIAVNGAGAAGTVHVTTIASFVSSTVVTFTVSAPQSSASAMVTVVNGTITRPSITVARNKILENECLNGTHGISLHFSDHCELISNVCEAQQHRNYILTASSYNKLLGNRGLEAESAGISLAYGCEHNEIIKNILISDSVSNSGGVDGDALHGYILCQHNLWEGNKVFSPLGSTNPFIYGYYEAVGSTYNQVLNNSFVGVEVGIGEETDWQADLPAGAIYSRENSADQIHVPATGDYPSGYAEIRGNFIDAINCGIYLAQVNNKSGVNPQELKHSHIDGNTITDRSTYVIYVFEETANKVNLISLRNIGSDATSTAKFSATRGRAHFNGSRIENVALLDDVTFRALSGTSPSVQFGRYFQTSNGSPTIISNFADGSDGQVIWVEFDGNTSVANNSFIGTAGKAQAEPLAGDVLVFVYRGKWRQISGLPNEFHHSLVMRDPIDVPYGYGIDVDSGDAAFSGQWARQFGVQINGSTQIGIGVLANGSTVSYGFIGGLLSGAGPPFGASEMWLKLLTTLNVEVPNGDLIVSGGDITTTNRLLSTGGVGVGNSAAATTPGSVVKKIQVFDASGNSLGFLAVYDAIT